jgi:hypothetical protein
VERVIGAEYIEAILARLLKVLDLPPSTPLMRLGPMLQPFILDEARSLQDEAQTHCSLAMLAEYGAPLTCERYLELDAPDVELDAEQESELPELFREDSIEERVAELLQRIDANPGRIQ